MKNAINLFIAFCFISILTNAQTATVTKQNTLIKPNHNYGLTNPVFDEGSPMTYNSAEVDTKGAAFSINYTNQGGTSFDGYPSGTVGGFKANGTYSPGNVSTCGMPIQIQDLTDELRINWKTSQLNADNADDKWWATINVIFDSGTANSEPDPNVRDYDLVIQNVSYLQDDFSDFINPGGRYWYFARESNGDIKPFTVYLNGTAYSWAVRYKFFDFPSGHSQEHKNDKVHIKFIPIDNSQPIPYLDHSLKQFIDCTKNYIPFLPLSSEELALANQKVAEDTLWIKSISAGYEIYEGASILNNDYFYTTLDTAAPNAPTNLTVAEHSGTAVINWDDSTDTAFDTYTVYRSENGGTYNLLASGLRVNTYTDASVSTENYDYYVTATDRSYNESSASNVASLDLSTSQTISLYTIGDAHVRNGGFKNDNYGSANNLQIREKNGKDLKRYAYLMFDVSSVSNITSATLRINNTGNNGTIDVHEVNDDNWDENTITWQNSPSIGNFITSASFNAVGSYDIDVTNFVSNEINNDGTVTIAFKGSTDNYMTISSKESGIASQLIIEYGSGSSQKTLNISDTKHPNQKIVMFPNPTKSLLNIYIDGFEVNSGKVQVFDSLGRLTQENLITASKMSIDLNGSAGIYLVKVENKGSVTTKRVVKL